ncbi:tRNA lysidine(34) synthetase TilS [Paracrocinitomix mangrovi]|uniref:tRNA lysidine(34) synthetase TilS n=1 Tax=Paracrocinitomix mangrovi TaxID=2862509 RepID=UPI001C8D4542|nr:tRNA lysidine(34) synthetase TilS [Paracrocinitomix mangrovi]UKN03039.1 tRNA lysidine(34) synthetase TilS [Paracrocinitomix mangrovi]
MLERFKEIIFSDYPDINDRKIFLAMSGGKDSMVLSVLLTKCNIKHILLHCNFHLRGEESDQDELFVRNYALKNQIELRVKNFNTIEEANNLNLNIQLAARKLRYDWFFNELKSNNDLLLTAHHLDDSIETFFINLLRGTGIKGILGIPKYNQQIYRPLNKFTVDDIYSFIDQQNIEYREDSSNKLSDKYLRNNIRHNIIPSFLELEPEFKKKMSSFFDEMSDINELIEKIASNFSSEIVTSGNLKSIGLEKVIQLNNTILLRVFDPFGIKRSNIKEFIKFLKNSNTGSIFKSTEFEFLLDRDRIFIRQQALKVDVAINIDDSIPAQIEIFHKQLKFELKNKADFLNDVIYLDKGKIEFPLKVRNWQNGDKILPLGLNGGKLVSDILIDKKFSLFEKEEIIVIEDNTGKLIAIPPFLTSENFKVDNQTFEILVIQYK